MVQRVRAYINQHQLLSTEGLHIVALSGGADSVGLLLCLKELGYRVEAVHCNFKLRGDESDRDERFVTALCQQHDTPLHIVHFDTRSYAELHHVSIEMAARQLRYRHFEQLRNDIGAETICVAHHQDDSVETVLLNLVRGTGMEGLTGIKPSNGHIVRPLLCLRRHDIEQWLQQRGQDYVTDSTNLVADVQRNRMRLEVIPLLEQLNPGAADNIARTARWMTEASHVYDAAIETALRALVKDGSISTTDLLSQPSPECVLFEWLTPYHFSPATITAIHEKIRSQGGELPQGLQWLSATHQLVTHNHRLIVAPRHEERPTLRMPETGNYHYDSLSSFSVKTLDTNMISRDSDTATLDADSVVFPLTVRPAQPGDRFVPFGMKGSKLVSDFLTDAKLSPIDKQRQLIIADASDRIIWLVGRRPDARCCVSPQTRRTLMITHSHSL